MLEASNLVRERYQLERRLGKNAGRQTWLARDSQAKNQELVVVKLLAFGGRSVPASDLYALGATLIHLLTRTPPADLPSRDLKIQFCDRVTVTDGLANWLGTMTALALERRFQTARECLATSIDLERADLSQFSFNCKNLGVPVIGYGKKSLKPLNTEVEIECSPQFIEIVLD